MRRVAPTSKPNPDRPNPKAASPAGAISRWPDRQCAATQTQLGRQNTTPASRNVDCQDERIDVAPSRRSSGWTGCRTPALGPRRSCPVRIEMTSLRRFADDERRGRLRLDAQERLSVNGPRHLRELRWKCVEVIGVRRLERFAVRHRCTKCGERSGVTAGSGCGGVLSWGGRLVVRVAQCGQRGLRRIEDRPDSSCLEERIGRLAFCRNSPLIDSIERGDSIDGGGALTAGALRRWRDGPMVRTAG